MRQTIKDHRIPIFCHCVGSNSTIGLFCKKSDKKKEAPNIVLFIDQTAKFIFRKKGIEDLFPS
jgi:hypothetical protein